MTILHETPKNAVLLTQVSFKGRPRSDWHGANCPLPYEIQRQKTRFPGLSKSEHCMLLRSVV